VVTGESTVVDDEGRQKGEEVNEIEDGAVEEKGKRLEEER
jgi:hypothetical protein